MEKLRKLRKEHSLTQQKVAKYLKISQQAYAKYELGLAEPDITTLNKLSELFDISIDYLIGDNNKKTPLNANRVRIPVLGSIPAGIPIDAIEDILDYEEITEDMARRGEYFALKVSGNSMTPLINDGDVVIIKQQEDADSGKICVVIIDDNNATLKEIKKEPNGLWVLPKNPYSDFQAVFFSNEEIINRPVKILGIAVEIRRSL